MLTGANGAGKSTFLRCLYGIEQPTEGAITVCGDAPDERSNAFRRKVSVLLDDSATFDELTPRQHLDLLCRSFGDPAPADAADLLAPAGLSGRSDVQAARLSAGQRRRLLLVAATARPHEVLLLDEPERALDADGRAWLVELVGSARRGGVAVVVASHHRLLIDEMADQVLEIG